MAAPSGRRKKIRKRSAAMAVAVWSTVALSTCAALGVLWAIFQPPTPVARRQPAIVEAAPRAMTAPSRAAASDEVVISFWAPGHRTASEYDELIDAAARKYQLAPALIQAVMHVESGFDARATSGAGAVGLMQLMPGTASDMKVRNRRDPRASIDGGSRYLRRLVDRFGGDLPKVIAAYNAGPNAVDRFGGETPPYAETEAYVQKVLALYAQYQRRPPPTGLYWPSISAHVQRTSTGVRIKAPERSAIRTVSDGEVAEVKRTDDGWVVRITHDRRYSTVYRALADVHVQVGAQLAAGAELGTAAAEGFELEVHEQGSPLDPLAFRWLRPAQT